MTRSQRIVLNAVALALLLIILAVETSMVSEVERQVEAGCQTRVAYDKTGSLYCVEVDQQVAKQ